MPKMFICYRRSDSRAYAHRLNDLLSANFGRQNVFIDVDTLRPGIDFEREISTTIAACDALLLIIGPSWLDCRDEEGKRRIDNHADFVRLEILTAVQYNKKIIPLLVDGAQMPRVSDLPAELAPLARRHAVSTDHERFRHDIQQLTSFLEREFAAFGADTSERLRLISPSSPAAGYPPRLPKSTFQNQKDGTLLIVIPEGLFFAGGERSDEGGGLFSVHLPAYYIALHPITNGQFRRFVRESGHPYPDEPPFSVHARRDSSDISNRANHPAVWISWEDAQAYCRWSGMRLPSELEWEKAARGTDGRTYPWGKKWDTSRCRNKNTRGAATTCAVWDYPSGASPYGLYNMAGNVGEWCEDSYFERAYEAYRKGKALSPVKDVQTNRVVRGGSWLRGDASSVRCAFRGFYAQQLRCENIGFRCAGNFLA